jgi:hypothetical protein
MRFASIEIQEKWPSCRTERKKRDLGARALPDIRQRLRSKRPDRIVARLPTKMQAGLPATLTV